MACYKAIHKIFDCTEDQHPYPQSCSRDCERHMIIHKVCSLLIFKIYLIGGQLIYNILVVLSYIDMNQPWVYMCSPSCTLLRYRSPSHPSGSSQCISSEHCVSCIEPGLAVCFTYDKVHVSMLFSQIIAPSHSPTESKSLFCTSVSLFLFCI